MNPKRKINTSSFLLWLAILVPAGLLLLLGYAAFGLVYGELKGPHRILTAVSDLDLDGDLDVVVGHTRWESEDISWAGVGLWFNQGDGLFTHGEQDLPEGFAAGAGDVDSDGDPDLVILNGYRLAFAINQGGLQGGLPGIFVEGSPLQPANLWRGHLDMGGSITLGYLDRGLGIDGFVAACCYGPGEDPSLATSRSPSEHWLWLNRWQPTGVQIRRTLDVPALDGLPVRAAALSDLDGDGDLDVFAAVGAPTIGETVSLADRVLLNDGSGRLAVASAGFGETDSRAVSLGDINGDGRPDALVGVPGGAVIWFNMSGFGEGAELVFSRSPQVLTGGDTRSVFLHDLDNDTDLDALIGDKRQAAIWWNLGQGEFLLSRLRFRHAERQGLAVADFDGDGLADIFSASDSGDYSLWLNQGGGRFEEAARP